MSDPLLREVYRYMGMAKGSGLDEEIEAVLKSMRAVESPRITEKRLPVSVEVKTVRIGDFEAESEALARNLTGCGEAYLLAATIGMGPDMLIKKAGAKSASSALMHQAAGAALIEEVVDGENARLKSAAEACGKKLRTRFSPGYGDFSIGYQKEFMRVLDMKKTIGVYLTDSLIMVPSKSVTAVIGIVG